MRYLLATKKKQNHLIPPKNSKIHQDKKPIGSKESSYQPKKGKETTKSETDAQGTSLSELPATQYSPRPT
ncbi:hypothetical protein ACVRZD_03240 [Streptococcus hongkongensis]|nr:hypothetical protein NC01_04600 [Streptococcus uberis]